MAKSAKSDLSRDAIVDRALALADTESLDAVTIRRLGQDFGVTPMALYWHVKNKDELLDAMGDRLFASIRYRTEDADAPWDVRLRTVVHGIVDALRTHPGVRELAYRRVFACRDGQELSEYTLGLLRRAGFSRRQTADIATHALQTAIMLVSAEPGAEPGFSPDEAEAKLAQKRAGLALLPADDFPYIREMGADLLHCDDVDAYYDFNVDLFVAGVRETLAGTRAGTRAAADPAQSSA